MELSEIQVQILTKFITAESLKYSEAKPEDVDNDLYKYHLKFLITKRYLEKVDDKYVLTDYGKQFGHKISPKGEVQDQFYVAVMCLVIVEKEGKKQILLQKRLKHPNYGETQAICGKVHKGELIVDAAKRKLLEESDLVANFKQIGALRVLRNDQNGKLVNDMWFMVCYTDQVIGEVMLIEKFWNNYFLPLDEFMKTEEKSNSVRNLKEIIANLNSKIAFIIEDMAVDTDIAE